MLARAFELKFCAAKKGICDRNTPKTKSFCTLFLEYRFIDKLSGAAKVSPL